jgi:hypothetical protein
VPFAPVPPSGALSQAAISEKASMAKKRIVVVRMLPTGCRTNHED